MAAVTGIPDDVRRAVLIRDGFQCWRCSRNVGHGVYSLHHRQGRRGPDPHRCSNLVTLCGTGTSGCHGWVTVHPQAAFDLGLSVPRLPGLDTRLVPVVCRVQTYALDDQGQRIPLGTNPDRLTAAQWAENGLVVSLYPPILDGHHVG